MTCYVRLNLFHFSFIHRWQFFKRRHGVVRALASAIFIPWSNVSRSAHSWEFFSHNQSSLFVLSHNLNPICRDKYMQPSIGAKTAAASENGFSDESQSGDEIIAAETTAPVRSALDTKRVLNRSPLFDCISFLTWCDVLQQQQFYHWLSRLAMFPWGL